MQSFTSTHVPQPTTEVTTGHGVYRFYAVMGCDNGHTFIAPPYTSTTIDCPKCEENRKAVHEQTDALSSQ